MPLADCRYDIALQCQDNMRFVMRVVCGLAHRYGICYLFCFSL